MPCARAYSSSASRFARAYRSCQLSPSGDRQRFLLSGFARQPRQRHLPGDRARRREQPALVFLRGQSRRAEHAPTGAAACALAHQYLFALRYTSLHIQAPPIASCPYPMRGCSSALCSFGSMAVHIRSGRVCAQCTDHARGVLLLRLRRVRVPIRAALPPTARADGRFRRKFGSTSFCKILRAAPVRAPALKD
jgi:hypothetical protein